MGALVEKFSGTYQSDNGKYKSFRVDYFGDQAAALFLVRNPERFLLAENAPCPHSGGGRKKYELRQTSHGSDIFSLDLLGIEIARVEKENPDDPTLAMLREGNGELETFIQQNGRYALDAPCLEPQESREARGRAPH